MVLLVVWFTDSSEAKASLAKTNEAIPERPEA